MGDDGLSVETSREVVSLLSRSPIGDQIGVVVIGPMDRMKSSEAADSLLKTLEDFDASILLPILWADDAGGVPGTIRSRCTEKWCPSPPGSSEDLAYLQVAESLCEAAIQQKVAAVIEILMENKDQELEILRASTSLLAAKEAWPLGSRLLLWDSLRECLSQVRPSPRTILAAYLI